MWDPKQILRPPRSLRMTSHWLRPWPCPRVTLSGPKGREGPASSNHWRNRSFESVGGRTPFPREAPRESPYDD
jgi:hypothetical protein